jgi:P27 family predicted phage terminase small subunit
MRKFPPPQNLSPASRALWRKLLNDFAIADAAGLLILRNLCEAVDRLQEAQRIIRADGIVVKDRWGQIKQHPASLVERDARQQIFAALRALRLDPSAIGGDE